MVADGLVFTVGVVGSNPATSQLVVCSAYASLAGTNRRR
jgi:hypothetical protein